MREEADIEVANENTGSKILEDLVSINLNRLDHVSPDVVLFALIVKFGLKLVGSISRVAPSPAGTKRRSQVTGHRSQVTENLMKKVRHSVKLFMFICLLYFRLSHNQAYVWHGPRFPVLFWEKRTKL